MISESKYLCDVARVSFSRYECGAIFLKILNLFSSCFSFSDTVDGRLFRFLGGLSASSVWKVAASAPTYCVFADLGSVVDGFFRGLVDLWTCFRTDSGTLIDDCGCFLNFQGAVFDGAAFRKPTDGEGPVTPSASAFVALLANCGAVELAEVLDLVM